MGKLRAAYLTGLFAGTLIFADAGLAQTPPAAPPPFQIKQVRQGIYMVPGRGANATLVIGTDGVVLVETKSPSQANFDDLLAAIKSVTPLPVKEVLVSHHHPDHAGNIGLFEAAGIPVVGHAAMGKAFETFVPPPGVKLSAPNVTFADKLTVTAGGVTAEAHYFGAGHTANDSIVYFPAQKLVVAGDVVEDTPNIDYPFGGTIAGWLQQLDAIAGLDFEMLIPGHGPEPMTKAEFLAFRQKAHNFAERARAAAKAGVPKEKLLVSIKTDDIGWPFTGPFWTAPARLDGFYAEMSR